MFEHTHLKKLRTMSLFAATIPMGAIPTITISSAANYLILWFRLSPPGVLASTQPSFRNTPLTVISEVGLIFKMLKLIDKLTNQYSDSIH